MRPLLQTNIEGFVPMSTGRQLRYTIREPVVDGFMRLLGALPLAINRLLGTMLGILFYLANGEMRKTSQRNIQACLPDLDPQEVQNLVKTSLIQTALGITESPRIWSWSKDDMHHFVKPHGLENLTRAIEAGKGVIILTPHIGSWEVVGAYISSLCPMTTLYRENRIQALNKYMLNGRARFGAKVVNTDIKGVKELMQALKRGEAVGILPDQDPGYAAGRFASFFGIEANTMTLTSRLARKSGCIILSTIAERLPGMQGYNLYVSEPVPGINDPDIAKSLRALNREVEKQVRDLPSQYMWSYKRFRRRPHGDDSKFY